MDQEENNTEEIRKKFSALPTEIKNLAYSAEMMEIIKRVADKNQLHLDKIEALEGEAVDVMTGYTAPRDFVASLVSNIEIDQIKAEAVAKDVNELLFSKIRDAMKKADLHVENMPAPSNPPAMSAPTMPTSLHLTDLSVVMPSSAAKAPSFVPPTPAPATPPLAIPAAPTKPLLQNMAHIDAMLSQPTVSVAPQTPPTTRAPVAPIAPTTDAPKPGPTYKTDPYHEPVD
jgi:hypothetical protein